MFKFLRFLVIGNRIPHVMAKAAYNIAVNMTTYYLITGAVIVVVIGLVLLRRSSRPRSPSSSDIVAPAAGSLTWDPADVKGSVVSIQKYVENEATSALDWYWRNKRSKAKVSRYIQASAIALTALGGLFPVIAVLVKELKWPYLSESGLWSSLFVGLAAALVGFDRAFGFSSGWARYVLTATAIRKSLEEFRLDWALMSAKSSNSVTADEAAALVQRAKDFRIGIEALVVQETREWATEFQNNVAQLEKDIKAQLEGLKAQVEKTIQAQAISSKPGSLQLTVPNADNTDGFQFEATLSLDGTQTASEKVVGAKTWARTGLLAGQYRLVVNAALAGKPLSAFCIVTLKPDEVTKAELALPS